MKFSGYSDEELKSFLSGSRFTVTYRLPGSEMEALEKVHSLCVEQTVEFPAEYIECGVIRTEILGRIADLRPAGENAYRAVISYADEDVGAEFPQLLNVVFGNSSILPDIVVERLDLSEAQKRIFTGPRYGVFGLREKLNVHGRPFTFTALKPMGLSAASLAAEAYRCALGGIDLIKDDHGILDQAFSPFAERVKLVSAAVQRANAETGGRTAYIANLSSGFGDMADRIKLCEECGVGGVLLAPGLVGFGMLRYCSLHTELPVVGHPAFLGSYVDRGRGGFECGCIFGQLPRLAGADIMVFPNFGGRFSLSEGQCADIRRMALEDLGPIRRMLPCPAGGMKVSKAGAMRRFYSDDAAFLIGGSLFTSSPDLSANCRAFREKLESGRK
jgi:ribulose-bisphosphate carboxylase large chain